MKYIIIFCDPLMERLVSADVISQHLFFKRTRTIFRDHNYIIKYFFEFLSTDEQQIYIDIDFNFTSPDDHIREKFNTDCAKILDIILNDTEYHNSFIVGFESIGFDKIMINTMSRALKQKNITLILSIYDPHAFVNQKIKKGLLSRVDFFENPDVHHITDQRLENADCIITPSALYFSNVKSKYAGKCKNIQFSFNADHTNFLIDHMHTQPFDARKPKILLSGALSDWYKHRITILRIIQKSQDISHMVVGNDMDGFSNIIEHQAYTIYNRYTTTPADERGIQYIRKISMYKAMFILFGRYPIDFPLCKLLEVFLAGSLAIIEPKKFLFDDYGLVAFEHYVPLLLDANEKIILNVDYYQQYLQDDIGGPIAKRGFEHVINNFTDGKVAEKYIDILSNFINMSR